MMWPCWLKSMNHPISNIDHGHLPSRWFPLVPVGSPAPSIEEIAGHRQQGAAGHDLASEGATKGILTLTKGGMYENI